MSGQDLNLALRIQADVKSALTELRQLRQDIAATGPAGKDAGAQAGRGLKNIETQAGTTAKAIATLKTQLVALFSITEAVRFAHDLVQTNVEMQRILYTLQAATGSMAAARKEFEFITVVANKYGLELKSSASTYAQLAAAAGAANIPLQQQHDIFIALARAGTVLHLSQQQMQSTLLAIEQMMSKGTVQAQELRLQLGQAIPGAVPRLQQALGVTGQEFEKLLQNGQLVTRDVMPALIQALMSVAPDNAVAEAIHSTNAELNRMHNAVWTLEGTLSGGSFIKFVTEGAKAFTDLARALSDSLSRSAENANSMSDLGDAMRTLVGGPLALLITSIKAASLSFMELTDAYHGWRQLLGQEPPQVSVIQQDRLNTLRAQLDALLAKRQELAAAGNSTDALSQVEAQIQQTNQDLLYAQQHPMDIASAYRAQFQKIWKDYQDLLDKIRHPEKLPPLPAPKSANSAPPPPGGGASNKPPGSIIDQLKASDEAKKQKKMGEALTQAVDPYAALNAEIARNNRLLDAGAITQETYNKAFDEEINKLPEVKKFWQEAGNSMSVFAEQAGRNIETSFANFLFDPFKNGVSGMVQGFADAVRQMAAQVAAQKILFSVFSSIPGLGDFAKGVKAHSGGVVGAGSSSVGRVSPLAFLGAPRYHTGGIVGLQPNEVPIIAQKGETILPNGYQPPAMGVQVINYTGQPAQTRQQQVNGRSIEQVIIGTVAEDVARGGQTWRAIAGKGGLKPKASGIG